MQGFISFPVSFIRSLSLSSSLTTSFIISFCPFPLFNISSSIIIPRLFPYPLPTSSPTVSLHYHVCLHCFIVSRLIFRASLSFYAPLGFFCGAETGFSIEVFIKQKSEVIYHTSSDLFMCSVCPCLQDSVCVTERDREKL